MNIAVTGSKGQLGLKIKDCSDNFQGFNFLYFDIDELDITDKNQIERLFRDYKIDALVNCAAYTAVDKAEEDGEAAEILNALAPGYLAEICFNYKAKFIHISTDYIFDGNAKTPYTEDSTTNPQSVYGATKLLGEKIVLEKNPDAVIIRTSWLYSEYGNNFVKTILRFAKEKEFLKVVNDQFGTPTYAGDLAYAVLKILDIFQKQNTWQSGVFHFSNMGVCTWYDFAVEILKVAKINTPVKPVDSSEFMVKAKRPAYSVFDKSKITSKFQLDIPNWQLSLQKMLKEYLS